MTRMVLEDVMFTLASHRRLRCNGCEAAK